MGRPAAAPLYTRCSNCPGAPGLPSPALTSPRPPPQPRTRADPSRGDARRTGRPGTDTRYLHACGSPLGGALPAAGARLRAQLPRRSAAARSSAAPAGARPRRRPPPCRPGAALRLQPDGGLPPAGTRLERQLGSNSSEYSSRSAALGTV